MLTIKVLIEPSTGGEAYEVGTVHVTNQGQDPAARVGDPWTHVYRYNVWDASKGKLDSCQQFIHDRDDGPLVCAQLALDALCIRQELSPDLGV